ncbi:MAG: FtsX-like permease family protein [Clostridiales bacterium]|nr:FtsX-like permease family protein [Clostridiales bacterium]
MIQKMRISDILGMSLTNLWRRKMRTLLTVLGVIIGTASIVVMLSLGIGLKQAMVEQVSSAGGLTEIQVTGGDDSGMSDRLLDDETMQTFLDMDHVESVEPQLTYSMPMQIGKYESDYVNIIGIPQKDLKEIELEEGQAPGTENGSLSLIVGNQVLGDSFFETATGEYPYWETNELPDVDLMKGPLFGGITLEDGYTDTDTSEEAADVPLVDSVDPAFAETDEEDFSVDEDFSVNDSSDTSGDNGTDFSDQSMDDGMNSPGVDGTDVSGNEGMDTSAENNTGSLTGDDATSATDAGATESDINFMNSGDTSLGYDGINEDGVDGANTYTSFTSDVKKVQLKVSGITAGTDSDYTEFSYNCYADIDSLKAFLKKNYTENQVIPGQPTDKSGKPYRDLKYSQFVVTVDDSSNVEDVLQEIQDMGYYGETNKEWIEETEKQFMIIEAVLGGIGAVAMLVAAISIANTMTMSTYERTKEIGVMKVLGCGLGNIRSMFLAEAAFIGFLGGIAGVVLSYVLSVVLNRFVAPNFMADMIADYGSDVNISSIPLWLVGLAIVFSTLIGMIAGFFPAQRATKLSPLAAIRNE